MIFQCLRAIGFELRLINCLFDIEILSNHEDEHYLYEAYMVGQKLTHNLQSNFDLGKA